VNRQEGKYHWRYHFEGCWVLGSREGVCSSGKRFRSKAAADASDCGDSTSSSCCCPPPSSVPSPNNRTGPSKRDEVAPPPSPILKCKCNCNKGDGEALGTVGLSESWQWRLWLQINNAHIVKQNNIAGECSGRMWGC
jgi:hypothetical protein